MCAWMGYAHLPACTASSHSGSVAHIACACVHMRAAGGSPANLRGRDRRSAVDQPRCHPLPDRRQGARCGRPRVPSTRLRAQFPLVHALHCVFCDDVAPSSLHCGLFAHVCERDGWCCDACARTSPHKLSPRLAPRSSALPHGHRRTFRARAHSLAPRPYCLLARHPSLPRPRPRRARSRRAQAARSRCRRRRHICRLLCPRGRVMGRLRPRAWVS